MVKQILMKYEKASGQMVNFNKSVISFSTNVKEDLLQSIQGILGLDAALTHEKFLGLPTLIGRNRKATFAAIKVHH